MPRVSIVVPAYRSASYLDGCLQSLEGQTHPDLEIIVVDDASPDKTAETVLRHAERDRRVVPLLLERNLGTLGARKAGVLASTGDYVMLVDQDDELEPRAVELLVAYAAAHSADIYHFAARVVAENETARQAAGGMTSFLTPMPRRLVGEEILKTQLAETGGFDWHVHHKMFRGDLARSCYAEATDERLVLSDDIYASFILCSRARSYEALPDSPWYLYHLGRGETYGQALTIETYGRLANADGRALVLAREYALGPSAPARPDWVERLDDLRDRLAFHAMNEWMDSLPAEFGERGCELALASLPADAVCGELYRFVRDRAYALLQEQDRSSDGARALERDALRYLELARRAEAEPAFDPDNARYREMREIACRHLRETGLMGDGAEAGPRPGIARRAWAKIRGALRR